MPGIYPPGHTTMDDAVALAPALHCWPTYSVVGYLCAILSFRVFTKEAVLTDGKHLKYGFLSIGLTVLARSQAGGSASSITSIIIWSIVSMLLSLNLHRSLVRGPRPRQDICLKGQVAIVTGANTGIGLEVTKALAERGARVFLACRDETKARLAINSIENELRKRKKPSHGNSKLELEYLPLDLSSFQSVRKAVDLFKEKDLPLHILVNNAGVMLPSRRLTSDGTEMTMTTNHYSHYLLTRLLLPEMSRAQDARVLNVTSCLHKVAGKLRRSDMAFEKEYSLFLAYSQSKLANVLFTKEITRRLESNSNIKVNCAHPGNVITEVTRNLWLPVRLLYAMFYPIFVAIQKLPEHGAYTIVHVVTSPAVSDVRGRYFVDSVVVQEGQNSIDPGDALYLWEHSANIVGLPVEL